MYVCKVILCSSNSLLRLDVSVQNGHLHICIYARLGLKLLFPPQYVFVGVMFYCDTREVKTRNNRQWVLKAH